MVSRTILKKKGKSDLYEINRQRGMSGIHFFLIPLEIVVEEFKYKVELCLIV